MPEALSSFRHSSTLSHKRHVQQPPFSQQYTSQHREFSELPQFPSLRVSNRFTDERELTSKGEEDSPRDEEEIALVGEGEGEEEGGEELRPPLLLTLLPGSIPKTRPCILPRSKFELTAFLPKEYKTTTRLRTHNISTQHKKQYQ